MSKNIATLKSGSGQSKWYHSIDWVVGMVSSYHPLVFCASAEGVPLGVGYWRWGLKN